jgi:ABC-type nitrate/sulfonate/bicarbonate transport system substrate-binding protein
MALPWLRALAAAWVAVLSLASFADQTAAAVAARKTTLLFADFSERAGLVFVAHDQRLFEEQGLDVDIVQVRSGPVAISALAANDAQFYMAPRTRRRWGPWAAGSTSRSSPG